MSSNVDELVALKANAGRKEGRIVGAFAQQRKPKAERYQGGAAAGRQGGAEQNETRETASVAPAPRRKGLRRPAPLLAAELLEPEFDFALRERAFGFARLGAAPPLLARLAGAHQFG